MEGKYPCVALIVGRCAGAQGLGGEVNTEHESI